MFENWRLTQEAEGGRRPRDGAGSRLFEMGAVDGLSGILDFVCTFVAYEVKEIMFSVPAVVPTSCMIHEM